MASDLEEVRVCRQVTRYVCAQISGVVGEQEVGLRQMLRTMGMLDSAYWLSWMLFEVPSNQHLHGRLATPTFFTWTDTLSCGRRGRKCVSEIPIQHV